MEPRRLFDRVRTLWPDVIILRGEASWVEGDPIWSAIHVYEAIERTVEDDDWLSLGAWAFQQALEKLAKFKIETGAGAVRPADVSFEAFDANMRKNLADETWADVRTLYDPNLG